MSEAPTAAANADMMNGGHDTTTKVTGRAATTGACPFRGTRVLWPIKRKYGAR